MTKACTAYRRAVVLLGACLVWVGGVTCASGDDRRRDPSAACGWGAAIDSQVLRFLGQLRVAHGRADEAQSRDDSRVAIDVLAHATQLPIPVDTSDPRGGVTPVALQAVADVIVRLALLRAEVGRFEAALRSLDGGLGLYATNTYERGRLLQTRGEVLLLQADALDMAGRSGMSSDAAEQAAVVLERVADIQHHVVNHAPRCAATAGIIGYPTLAFLSLAQATHALADMAALEGDHGREQAKLRRLVEIVKTHPVWRRRSPNGGTPQAPFEVREVVGDTLARLAELSSAEGDFDGARADLDWGLALAIETTHFRGRLIEVTGVVEERRYLHLLANGQAAAAETAKSAAIAAFERALAVQTEILDAALLPKVQ